MSFMGKFFVFLFGLAVLAVVGAWIMGGESVKHSTSISIDASPTSVFRYLTDGEKIKQWASDIVSIGSFSDDVELRTQKRVVREDGKEVVWEDSLIRFQNGKPEAATQPDEDLGCVVSIQSRKGGLTRTYVYQLEKNEIGGTDLTYRLTRSASGVDKFFFPFKEDDSDVKMATEMTRLKKLIESEVDPSDMRKPETIEDDAPLDGSDATSDNGSQLNLDPSVEPISMEDDPVQSPATPEPVKKQALSERNFESLFGTGLPR